MSRRVPGHRPPLFGPTPQTPAGAAEHAWYRACRDHLGKRGIRAALTRIWNRLGGLLPEDPEQFVDQFRRDFPARSWELYVLSWLARSGARVHRAPSTGPDFCATHPVVGRFWIECVVPTHGEGPNRVWERPDHVTIWSGQPDEPLALRYTSAVQAKIRKITAYRTSNILQEQSP